MKLAFVSPSDLATFPRWVDLESRVTRRIVGAVAAALPSRAAAPPPEARKYEITWFPSSACCRARPPRSRSPAPNGPPPPNLRQFLEPVSPRCHSLNPGFLLLHLRGCARRVRCQLQPTAFLAVKMYVQEGASRGPAAAAQSQPRKCANANAVWRAGMIRDRRRRLRSPPTGVASRNCRVASCDGTHFPSTL